MCVCVCVCVCVCGRYTDKGQLILRTDKMFRLRVCQLRDNSTPRWYSAYPALYFGIDSLVCRANKAALLFARRRSHWLRKAV